MTGNAEKSVALVVSHLIVHQCFNGLSKRFYAGLFRVDQSTVNVEKKVGISILHNAHKNTYFPRLFIRMVKDFLSQEFFRILVQFGEKCDG